MQALTWNIRQLCKLPESQRRVDEITQNDTCRFRLPANEQRRRFVKKFPGKRRIPIDPSHNRFLEVSC